MVVGGGAAGLNGALVLARSRRSVLVVDSGAPRNAPAEAVHGFIVLDGTAPSEILARGREQVRHYGGRVVFGELASAEPAEPVAGDPRFALTLADGRGVSARRVLVATGLRDVLPEVPGLAGHWGRGVVHCPYCHGWEVRDEPIGILATGPGSLHHALLFRQLTDDLVYFSHGTRVDRDTRARLAARGIRVIDTAVTGIVADAGAPTGVRLADGTVVARRVIAVATRTLALLGADVLRVDAPGLPESQEAHNDTGLGKRSALLDLAHGADRRIFDELLDAADVVVTGYRPGALDRFGLAPEALAERRPGLVVARLSAWGAYGPWGGRRGFDSLVQAATGIALLEGDEGRPGALPAQALDHGTGYLVAAGVLRALTERRRGGGTWRVEAALAQTARWLTHGTEPEAPRAGERPGRPYEPGAWLVERDAPLGRLRHALSPVSYEGGPADWARPPGRWGADEPRWTA
ncbi:CoA transferase [Streptomyces fradiae]|uniref:CoA transferase n=1 Tax=Streptomyces fradiae TaxID=1906 RepID=UPI0021560D16|nr:CoA transferase [Streptomyces fradiae]